MKNLQKNESEIFSRMDWKSKKEATSKNLRIKRRIKTEKSRRIFPNKMILYKLIIFFSLVLHTFLCTSTYSQRYIHKLHNYMPAFLSVSFAFRMRSCLLLFSRESKAYWIWTGIEGQSAYKLDQLVLELIIGFADDFFILTFNLLYFVSDTLIRRLDK